MFSQNRWAEQKGYSVRPPQVRNEDSSISGFRDNAGSVVRDDAGSHHGTIWSVYGEICGVVLGRGAPSGSLSTGSFSSWTARRVPIQKGSTTWSRRGFAVLG